MKAIVYLQENGRVAIVYPTDQGISLLGVSGVARKDVPAGVPFKIINVDDIPKDRGEREKWRTPLIEMADGVGDDD